MLSKSLSVSLIFAVFFSTFSIGQFAIIADKDGYTNVREDANKANKIIDTLRNGHLIYRFEDKGNWASVEYFKKDKEINGYIYYDRYKSISAYLKIPLAKQTDSSVRFLRDSIEVVLTERPFEKRKHKFKYYKESPDQIELIDGKQYWGMDGGMPKTEYTSIRIKIGKRIILLPKTAIQNLYQPSFHSVQVNFDKGRNIIYIQSMNSDGAGSYEVVWKVENGIYKERLVAYGF